jgi:hypothetical protein
MHGNFTKAPKARRVRRSRLLLAGIVLGVPLTAGPGAVSAAAQPSAPAVIVCDPGDACVFDDNGRRGLIADWPATRTGRFNLTGGRDRTSSWQNTGTATWCAYDQRTLLPDQMLFRLNAGGRNDYVGNAVNDRADYFVRC